MVAASRLQSLIDSRDYSREIAELRFQLGKINDAVQVTVPRNRWGRSSKPDELEEQPGVLDVGADSFYDGRRRALRPDRVHTTRTTSFDLRSYPDVPLWTNGSRSTGRARPSGRRTSGSPQIDLVRCRLWCGRRPTGVDLVGYVLSWRNRVPLRRVTLSRTGHWRWKVLDIRRYFLGAKVPQQATQHIQSRYHRQQGRGNEDRKPERTIMVGMPSNHSEHTVVKSRTRSRQFSVR